MEHATLAGLASLTSAMHIVWLRYVGGRLESRYHYSIDLVYNTFPVPLKGNSLSTLEPLAQAVINARAVHPNASLADLYAPDLMPPICVTPTEHWTQPWTVSSAPAGITNRNAWRIYSRYTNR